MTTKKMIGWVKIHRKIMNSKIWNNPIGLKVWMWCLLKTSHEDRIITVNKIKVPIKPGQFVFGRKLASKELHQPESTIRNWMLWLKTNNYIKIKPTNKYSVITIINWKKYQKKDNRKSRTTENKATTKDKNTLPKAKRSGQQNGQQEILIKNDKIGNNKIKETKKGQLSGQHLDTYKNVLRNNNINNRATPSVDNSSEKVNNPPKRGMSDIADALQSRLEKMKKTKPARNVPEWMQHALEVADKLHIDWNHPELVKENIKPRWFSLFKRKPWGELQSAYSFCYDYPNRPDSAGMVKLFFWKSGHKDLKLAPRQTKSKE